MKHSRKITVIGSLLITGAVALTLMGIFTSNGMNEATAKSSSSTTSSSNITYKSSYINKVVPGNSGDEIRTVYSFPGTSCFLVRTDKALTVWERRGSRLVKLREIEVKQRLEEILFLDDGRTFIVQTSKEALVYSIDMIITAK